MNPPLSYHKNEAAVLYNSELFEDVSLDVINTP